MADRTSVLERRPTRLVVVSLVGAILGFLGARYVLVGSGWSLLPWGLVAVLVGVLARTRRQAAVDGGVYGFVLAVVFMVAGYSGTEPLVGRLIFFVVLGLVGAVCASLLALAGTLVRSPGRRQSR